MPLFSPAISKKKPIPQVKGGPRSKNLPLAEPSNDDDDDDDDCEEDGDDTDDDDDDGADFDEDLDEIDEDVSLDDEDESDDGVDEQPVPKKQKLNGAGKAKAKAKTPKQEDLKHEKDKPGKKKDGNKVDEKNKEAKKSKEATDLLKKEKDKQPVEDRAAAVGPLTEVETKMFADNFRAMSATSIFVGKLPEDATEEELKKLHPAIRVVRRPVTRKGLPRTFAFLNFPNKETADRALKEINSKGPVKIRGQEVLVSENGNGQCHPPGLVDRRKLKIYGCPKHVSKEEIQKKMGCVDVLLSERDKGHAIEAVAIYRTSADAKKVLASHQTVTLNEAICAIFYLNISHNVKQHERKKDRKQAIKKEVKERKARAKARVAEAQDDLDDENDDEDGNDGGDSVEVETSNPQKPPKKSAVKQTSIEGTNKKLKRSAPQDTDDEESENEEDNDGDDVEEAPPVPKKKSMKKVSMKTPQRTLSKEPMQKKSPRKGTPFKHNGLASKSPAKKIKV